MFNIKNFFKKKTKEKVKLTSTNYYAMIEEERKAQREEELKRLEKEERNYNIKKRIKNIMKMSR